MTEPQLSFIFVNYQSALLLEKALASLVPTLTGLSHEVIVVNNDAEESERLREASGRNLFRLVDLSFNVGFGRANNEGAKVAQGKHLVFLNPDTEFLSGDFKKLAEDFSRQPEAVYGFQLLTPEGKPEPWTFGKAPTLGGLLFSKIFHFLFPRTEEILNVDWVGGAALALSREVFNRIGGFDETFFLYFEDVDLCLRAKKTGAVVRRYPSITFRHRGGQSHADYRSMKEAYFAGQRRYFQKHRPQGESLILSLLKPLYRRFFS